MSRPTTPIYLKEPIPTPEEVSREVSATVSQIIDEVEREGTAAVRRHSVRLDGWDPHEFRVGAAEIEAAYVAMEPTVEESARFLIDQVTNFASLQRKTLIDFETETLPGVFLGQTSHPGGLGGGLFSRRSLPADCLGGDDGGNCQGGGGASGDSSRSSSASPGCTSSGFVPPRPAS